MNRPFTFNYFNFLKVGVLLLLLFLAVPFRYGVLSDVLSGLAILSLVGFLIFDALHRHREH